MGKRTGVKPKRIPKLRQQKKICASCTRLFLPFERRQDCCAECIHAIAIMHTEKQLIDLDKSK
jgi:hypothetical protein